MTTLRTAAQLALEAMLDFPDDISDEMFAAIDALKAALAQKQAEPVQEPVAWLYEAGTDRTLHWHKPPLCGTPLYTAPPQRQPLTEPDLSRCPQCNGPADNGHDRSIPPNPYLCTKCMAEPVASLMTHVQSGDVEVVWNDDGFDRELWHETPLYTAPTKRKPLTDEEILKAIDWERAEMYMKLTPNFPVAEAKKETLKNARAIERAHGIGETK